MTNEFEVPISITGTLYFSVSAGVGVDQIRTGEARLNGNPVTNVRLDVRATGPAAAAHPRPTPAVSFEALPTPAPAPSSRRPRPLVERLSEEDRESLLGPPRVGNTARIANAYGVHPKTVQDAGRLLRRAEAGKVRPPAAAPLRADPGAFEQRVSPRDRQNLLTGRLRVTEATHAYGLTPSTIYRALARWRAQGLAAHARRNGTATSPAR